MELDYELTLPLIVKGHCLIEDDIGNILLDKENAIHPQNMARVIARALSREDNYRIHRIAFGNGGTNIDAAFTVLFKTPNDGQPPDIQTWDSRLYNETYSEIVDDSIAPASLLGTDPGSADARVGVRPGGGAVPEDDTSSNFVESRSLGLTSEVKIEVLLNPSEPLGQIENDQTANTSLDSSFTFDELGLFTTGAPGRDSTGSQDVDVGDKTSTDITPLLAGIPYDFKIKVDGATSFATISLTSPAANPTYGELIEALRDPTGVGLSWNVTQPLPGNAIVSITDTTFGTYPSISGDQTFGFLRFISDTAGSTSTIELAAGTVNDDLFASLSGTILAAVDGVDKGVEDNLLESSTEQERLLTHLIFTPVLKAANRTLKVTYTLTIAVARSAST